MSYILDALKRADAQRERGAVPRLHARQVTTPAPQGASSARNRIGLAVAATLTLGGLAAGLWIWQTPVNAVRLAAVEPAVASPPLSAPLAQPIPTPTPNPASASSMQAVVPAPRAAVSSPLTVAPDAPKTASPPAPPELTVGLQAPPKPGLDPAPKETQPGPAAAATPSPPPDTKATSKQAAPAAVPLLSQLSEDVRRQIPPLAITGAVYSENPGQRLLLVNNQVLSQGSLAAPDVNLEEIGVRSSVFSFRGTRFRVAH